MNQTSFPADEILIAAQTEPAMRLADELVSRARDHFTLPVSRASESLRHAA